MALLFSGSGQFLTQAVAVATGYPMTFACYWKPTTIATLQTMISICRNTTSSEQYLLWYNNGVAIQARTTAAGVSVNANETANPTIGQWYSLVAVFANATSRIIYVNGVPVSNATGNTPGPVNMTAIGCQFAGSASAIRQVSGSVAYPAIWKIALSQAEAQSHYSRLFTWSNTGVTFNWTNSSVAFNWSTSSIFDPRTVESANLVSFSLLDTGPPYLDSITGNNWTLTGSPTIVADPFGLAFGVGPVAGNVAVTANVGPRRVLRPLSHSRF